MILKKGVQVKVIAGKDKGKSGTVLGVLNEKVMVSGVNLVTKSKKQNPNTGEKGGLVKQESPLHISNVSHYDPNTKTLQKVTFKFIEGKKQRELVNKLKLSVGAK